MLHLWERELQEINVPLWAPLGAVWFAGYMLIALVRYRGKMATLGKGTFYLFSTVYAGVEVLGLAIFMLAIEFASQADLLSRAHVPGLLAVMLAGIVYVTGLMVVKKLPFIREVLEALTEPSVSISQH